MSKKKPIDMDEDVAPEKTPDTDERWPPAGAVAASIRAAEENYAERTVEREAAARAELAAPEPAANPDRARLLAVVNELGLAEENLRSGGDVNALALVRRLLKVAKGP